MVVVKDSCWVSVVGVGDPGAGGIVGCPSYWVLHIAWLLPDGLGYGWYCVWSISVFLILFLPWLVQSLCTVISHVVWDLAVLYGRCS